MQKTRFANFLKKGKRARSARSPVVNILLTVFAVFGVIMILVTAIQRGWIPTELGELGPDGREPEETVTVGTSRHPTITTFITNAILGTNVGDDTNDHAYIIELREAYKTASYEVIKAAYMSDPASVCEPRSGWDDTTPPAAGVASQYTYDVGTQVLIYIDAQTEHDIVYLYTVKEPDYQATTVQVSLPVFTAAAAWGEVYQTEISTIISASSNYDISDEGSDTEDQITWTIRSTTADSVLGWYLKDPIKDATRYKYYIPYFYVTSNISAMMCTDSDAAWDDGTNFNYFYDLSSQVVSPAEWGCPTNLQVISGEPIGVNVDADATDGFITGVMTWSVITTAGGMTCGLEATDWEQEFGLGTPTGDVTELIQTQA